MYKRAQFQNNIEKKEKKTRKKTQIANQLTIQQNLNLLSLYAINLFFALSGFSYLWEKARVLPLNLCIGQTPQKSPLKASPTLRYHDFDGGVYLMFDILFMGRAYTPLFFISSCSSFCFPGGFSGVWEAAAQCTAVLS